MQTQLFQDWSWLRRKPNSLSPPTSLLKQLYEACTLAGGGSKNTLPQARLYLTLIRAAQGQDPCTGWRTPEHAAANQLRGNTALPCLNTNLKQPSHTQGSVASNPEPVEMLLVVRSLSHSHHHGGTEAGRKKTQVGLGFTTLTGMLEIGL